MNTFLLTWNPTKWYWKDYKDATIITRNGKVYSDRWSCNTRQIHVGDRIFLIRLGSEPRGIIASGYVTSELYKSEHWNEEKRMHGIPVNRVNIDFDVVLDSDCEEILSMEQLKNGYLSKQHWSSQTSGILIQEEVAIELEKQWMKYTQNRINNNVNDTCEQLKILSLPAKGTYNLIKETLIHAHPTTKGYNYKYTDVITFRNKGGIMEDIYTVEKSISILPTCKEIPDNLSEDEKQRIKRYIENRSTSFGFQNMQTYKFYILRPFIKLNSPFVQSPNLQSPTYYYLHEIYKDVGEANVEFIDMQHEYEFLNQDELPEGAKKQIIVNAYERNPIARKKCLDYYGSKCRICGFDSRIIYGKKFADKIQVHHRKPLSEINEEYIVDPIKDLLPVCANCHMIIHSKTPAYTVEEIKEIVETMKNKKNMQ